MFSKNILLHRGLKVNDKQRRFSFAYTARTHGIHSGTVGKLPQGAFFLAARLCDKFAERLASCGYTREDIEQDCFLILLKMIEAYDPYKGYKFTSYANFHIKTYFLRDVLGYDRSKKEFVKPLNGASSLDKPIGDGEDEELTPMNLLEDETAELAFENTVESIYQNELHTAIEKAMCECLNETQRRVICERYFKSNTLKQIAELAGMSTSAVYQNECNSLRKLRSYNAKTKAFDGFRNEILETSAYHNTGFASFSNYGASSVELATEKADKLTDKGINSRRFPK